MDILRGTRSRASKPLGRIALCGALCWGLSDVASAIRAVGPPCDPNATTQTLSFVHVGDLHGRYGASFAHKWARMQRYYQDALSTNPYTLFTNAGDDFEKGSVAEQASQGLASRLAAFAMGFDVRVLGNHDYAWGEAELLAYSNDPKAIVLASNTVYSGTNPIGFGAVDYGELQLGCVKVGFFGFVSKPWNEFDTQYTGDFLPNFAMRWDWVTRAKQIIAARRSSVDLLVMVSHLGIGTDSSVVNNTPKATDSKTSNIDLVLGGHNHGGFQSRIVKKTLIVQPEFYGDGLTRVDLVWDVRNRRLVSRTPTPSNILTSTLSATDAALQQALQDIVEQYAPDWDQQLGTLELRRTYPELAAIAAQSGMATHDAQAALLDPALTWVSAFDPGAVTQQMFDDLYRVERQRPGTPGFNGLYTATVSGAELSAMRQAQPGWVYVGPAAPAPASDYTVLLHKAPALNPATFFPSNPNLRGVAFKSETWLAMDQYARARTAACMHLDTDTTLPSCLPPVPTLTSVWNFDDPANRFGADIGPSTLSWRDVVTQAGTGFPATGGPGLPNLPDGASSVMAFPQTAPAGGYVVTHGFPANGAFKASGLVSNYTLVMDVLWPAASDGVWRALLQTNPANGDDADWFVKNAPGGGIGISQYFGSLQPGGWYRIAMVVNAQASGGSLQFYVDGALAGTINSAGQRHALASQLLLFADNNGETAAGYVNAVLLSDRSWTAPELAALGGAKALMALPSSAELQAQMLAGPAATAATTGTTTTATSADAAPGQAAARTAPRELIVVTPPATRKDVRKGSSEFDNKSERLKSQ